LSQAERLFNEVAEEARALAGEITEPALERYDAKSERWQDSDAGIRVRMWIEEWEAGVDDVELVLPDLLDTVDPDNYAGVLERSPATPADAEN
jgi:hypothetical protein